MNNELMLTNNSDTYNKEIFTSCKMDNLEDKKKMFNALDNCDFLLNDKKGSEIILKDIYIEKITKPDDETGEINTKYRTILFDVDGVSYATGSYGIYNAIVRLTKFYGDPTWEDGIPVKIVERKLEKGKTQLTLEVI